MNAMELRLGNWVQRPESVRIDILDGGIYYWQVDLMMLRDCIHHEDNWAFEPIPLSPEILEVNCKFTSSLTTDPQERGASKVYKKEGIEIHQPNENVNYFFVVRQSDEWFIELKTLHQLQNYYFANTSLELPFTNQ